MNIYVQDIINTTPHDVVVHRVCGTVAIIKSDPRYQLRMKQSAPTAMAMLHFAASPAQPIHSAPSFEAIEGPIEELVNKTILVSMPVGNYMREHRDRYDPMVVLGPDTSPAMVVRNDEGAIVGTNGLIMYYC